MTLLIVDDSAHFRRLLRMCLSGESAEFYECATGAEAVEVYEQCSPDWVLMDFEMPEMDGLTATAKIIAAHPQARIVIVTQHNDKHLQEAAEQAGAIAFITKENLLDVRAFLASAPAKDCAAN